MGEPARRVPVGEVAPPEQQRSRHAKAKARHGHLGGPEQERATHGQQQRQHVLGDDQPGVDLVLEACPDQRGVVVEQAVGDRNRDGEAHQPFRKPDVEAR